MKVETEFRSLLQNAKHLYVILLSLIIIAVSYITIYVNSLLLTRKELICAGPLPISMYIPVFFSVGIVTGYILNFVVRSTTRDEINKDLLKVLDSIIDDEIKKFVIKNLITRGYILQSELSKKFGRVKAHRCITKLESKGIVKRVPYGRTYKIILNL